MATGCSTPNISKLNIFPSVYKITIQQGNVITQKMVDQLAPGMTKRQVQYVMGTALIKDTFHPNRWDYVYSTQPGGEVRQQELLTLYFDNNVLTHFQGDYMPSSAVIN